MNHEKRKILIAEDTPIQAKKLVYYLEKIGFAVTWVMNGRLALEALDNNNYELIISDVQMPEIDGLQLVRELRASALHRHIPIIVVTTLEEIDVKIEALKNGASDFLTKPYSIEELEIRAKNQIALFNYQKLLENENTQLTEELVEKNKELEANFAALNSTHEQLKTMQIEMIRVGKMNTLGMLGAGIAHEVNNPLSIISGLNQKLSRLILTGSNDLEAMKKCTTNIDSNVKRISGIIQQLRRVSGRFDDKIMLVPIDVNQFISDVESLLSSLLISHNINYKKIINTEMFLAYINETNLSQTIINLVQNASDAMENQSQKEITVTLYDENDFLYIEIKDNGPGIPKEIQDRVFDPFFTTKDPHKGTGLGLSLSHTYMKEMGGGIDFTTSEHGTVFKLYVPLAKENKKVSNG